MLALSLLFAAACAQAQDARVPPATPASVATPANTATLDTITVTAKRPDELDLYTFKNPMNVQGSAFDRYYHAPPTPEEISKIPGGYITYGLLSLVGKAMDGVKRIPGWKSDQPRNPHPPPLSDEQLQRAIKLQQQDQAQPAATPGN